MKTGYKDCQGKEYCVGDIALNTKFFDLWIVGKYSDSPIMKDYENNCPFYFCKDGDPDRYFMDINIPTGFIKLNKCDCYECYRIKKEFYKNTKQKEYECASPSDIEMDYKIQRILCDNIKKRKHSF